MRIMFFTDTYDPQINGVVTSIKTFRRELEKLGHEVAVVCPGTGKEPGEKMVFRVPSFRFRPYPEYRGGLPLGILKRVRDFDPDIIHVHSPASVGLAGVYAARKLGIPCVATYHTLLEEYFKYFLFWIKDPKKVEKISKKLMKGYTKVFYNLPDAVISPSKEMKAELEKRGVRCSAVIPTGVAVCGRRKKPERRFVYAGRLGKEKNVDTVIRAFSKVSEEAELVIIGDGPARKDLEKLAGDLGISDRVRFTGYLEHEELLKSDLLGRATAFVSASTTETQGLVILEAMALGCPVLVPRALGPKDFVKDGVNGMFFSGQRDLSRKMVTLLKRPELRERLSKNALKTARAFEARKLVKKLEELYEKLAFPKVSVVVPAFNEERYIERTLKSLKRQTYRNMEIVVVDNRSEDRTAEIARKYAKVVEEPKRGISAARNRGARECDGEVVLFIDADTVPERDFVERVAKKFRDRRVVGACGFVESEGSAPARLVYRICSELVGILTAIGRPMFYGMCAAYRKEVFEKVGGFDENLETAEDIDLTMRISKYGKCVFLRDARAKTSPRRIVGMGLWKAVGFHVVNFFRHTIFRSPAKNYEAIR